MPVAEILYFRQPPDPVQMTAFVRQLFQAADRDGTQLLLLNGVWNTSPEIQKLIIKAAKARHVIVADELDAAVLRRQKYRNANRAGLPPTSCFYGSASA